MEWTYIDVQVRSEHTLKTGASQGKEWAGPA